MKRKNKKKENEEKRRENEEKNIFFLLWTDWEEKWEERKYDSMKKTYLMMINYNKKNINYRG